MTNHNPKRKGAALLIVLSIVMAVMILSLGFLARSDVELACGKNMVLRNQMDYLAESGLEHAKGLILTPQDVDSQYWTGDVGQQLVAGSDDYYDVNVVKLSECNYQITCEAYREKGGDEIGRSRLTAELRLDSCIAYWAGDSTEVKQRVTINGDIYCDGSLSGNGDIYGDVFASDNITASNIEGRQKALFDPPPVDWPGLEVSDFSSTYYIDGSSYSVDLIDPCLPIPSPGLGNPAGVLYCPNDLELSGNVNIAGMLVVDGNVVISGANNVITAVKNFPALLVSGEVVIENGGALTVNGLAQIARRMVISSGAENVDIDILGGLFIAGGGIDGPISSTVSIDITAAPDKAALQIWPTQLGNAVRWSPVGGAFYRSIQRQ